MTEKTAPGEAPRWRRSRRQILQTTYQECHCLIIRAPYNGFWSIKLDGVWQPDRHTTEAEAKQAADRLLRKREDDDGSAFAAGRDFGIAE